MEYIIRFYYLIRDFIGFLVSILLSILAPFSMIIYALVALFTINCWVGWRTDEVCNAANFSMHKLAKGLELFVTMLALVVLCKLVLMAAGRVELSDDVMNWSCIVIAWGYVVKILSNLRRMHPGSLLISVLYKFLALDVIRIVLERYNLKADEVEKAIQKNEHEKDEKRHAD